MAERRCSAHADVEQSDGSTLTARKPRDPLSCYIIGSGYGYGTVPGGRWAIDTEGGHVEIPYPECEMAMNTEGGHVVDSVSRIRNGYEYGRRSRGRLRIPPAILAICRC